MKKIKKVLLLIIALLGSVLVKGMVSKGKVLATKTGQRRSYKVSPEDQYPNRPPEIAEAGAKTEEETQELPWIEAVLNWIFGMGPKVKVEGVNVTAEEVNFTSEEIEALRELDSEPKFVFLDRIYFIKPLLKEVIEYLTLGKKGKLEEFLRDRGFDDDTIQEFGFDHDTAKKIKEHLIEMAETQNIEKDK